MKKWSFFGATSILIASIIFSLAKPDIAPEWLDAINTIIAAILAYSQFLYSNSKNVFIFVNKILSNLKNDTVVWKGSYKFSLWSDNYFFCEHVKSLKKRIEKKFTKGKIKHLKINKTSATFKFFDKGYSRDISLYVDKIGEDMYQIRFSYECSLSYRDSKQEIERFSELLSEVSKGYSVIGSDEAEDNSQLDLYSVKISFSKFNPFYRLTVKNISDVEDINFTLKFIDDETTVEIGNNTLSASAKKKEKLLSVLKNYVALSSIG